MRRGRFISLEGPEGCGKSTHARWLAERLEREGISVVLTREPGGTPIGEAIRELLQHRTFPDPICAETEALLFSASRAQLVRQVILPALAQGRWVIADRFMDSTTVYQGYARGLDLRRIEMLHRIAVGEAIPDLTIVLDVDVETSARRLHERYGTHGATLDRLEREDRAFHERVRAGYHDLAQREPHRVRLISSVGEPGQVAEQIWREVWNALR